MNKHTPGPWTLGDEHEPLVSAPDGQYVAQVLMYEGGTLRRTGAADAALIAAAPALLDALLRLNAQGALHSRPEYGSEYNDVLDFCRSAIRSAGGAA